MTDKKKNAEERVEAPFEWPKMNSKTRAALWQEAAKAAVKSALLEPASAKATLAKLAESGFEPFGWPSNDGGAIGLARKLLCVGSNKEAALAALSLWPELGRDFVEESIGSGFKNDGSGWTQAGRLLPEVRAALTAAWPKEQPKSVATGMACWDRLREEEIRAALALHPPLCKEALETSLAACGQDDRLRGNFAALAVASLGAQYRANVGNLGGSFNERNAGQCGSGRRAEEALATLEEILDRLGGAEALELADGPPATAALGEVLASLWSEWPGIFKAVVGRISKGAQDAAEAQALRSACNRPAETLYAWEREKDWLRIPRSSRPNADGNPFKDISRGGPMEGRRIETFPWRGTCAAGVGSLGPKRAQETLDWLEGLWGSLPPSSARVVDPGTSHKCAAELERMADPEKRGPEGARSLTEGSRRAWEKALSARLHPKILEACAPSWARGQSFGEPGAPEPEMTRLEKAALKRALAGKSFALAGEIEANHASRLLAAGGGREAAERWVGFEAAAAGAEALLRIAQAAGRKLSGETLRDCEALCMEAACAPATKRRRPGL